ncbi:MAG TPA: hypothetical protein VJT31_18740 [Rugosimonospora sp.]|nr:hypothetical protein [Rugosimonospora sp.]
MKPGGWRPPVAAAATGEGRTPTGILVGVGCVAVVAAASLASLIPVVHTGWRFAVVAAAVGLFALAVRDAWAVTAVGVLAWLVVNGFLVDRMGELSWHGSPDVLRLMLLVLVGALGVALGEGIHGWRAGAAVRALVLENDEKEKRDA